MPKFRSTARKMGRDMVVGPSKNRVFFPHIHFDDKQLPEILDWRVGGSYQVILKIKQTSIRKEEKEPASADFDVTAVAVMNDNTKDEAVKKLGNKLSERKNKDL